MNNLSLQYLKENHSYGEKSEEYLLRHIEIVKYYCLCFIVGNKIENKKWKEEVTKSLEKLSLHLYKEPKKTRIQCFLMDNDEEVLKRFFIDVFKTKPLKLADLVSKFIFESGNSRNDENRRIIEERISSFYFTRLICQNISILEELSPSLQNRFFSKIVRNNVLLKIFSFITTPPTIPFIVFDSKGIKVKDSTLYHINELKMNIFIMEGVRKIIHKSIVMCQFRKSSSLCKVTLTTLCNRSFILEKDFTAEPEKLSIQRMEATNFVNSLSIYRKFKNFIGSRLSRFLENWSVEKDVSSEDSSYRLNLCNIFDNLMKIGYTFSFDVERKIGILRDSRIVQNENGEYCFQQSGYMLFQSNLGSGCNYCGDVCDGEFFMNKFALSTKPPVKPKKKMKWCSRCGTSVYCSKECQRKDWKQHKEVCSEERKDVIAQGMCEFCRIRKGDKKCSRCKKVRYCSKKCQSKDWKKKHGKICSK